MNGTITIQQANDEWYNENSQVQDCEDKKVLKCIECGDEIEGNGNEFYINEKCYCEYCYLNEKERIETLQENQDREDAINGK